ncbi:DoxX family protein [Haloarchaeobius sp. TZWWS8]|uniref:DoxX family protein n=1 Tax=Haloarchaeobius sp. TZWWS8 TaxID=3446121 RepID=UPI003EBF1559
MESDESKAAGTTRRNTETRKNGLLGRVSDADLSAALLRLGLGLVFVVHGFGKLTGIGPAGSGIDGFSAALASLGVPAPVLMAWVVGLIEAVGGVLLLLGVFHRIAAIGIALVMVGAIFLVHLPNGFVVSNGGYEFALVLLLVSVALSRMDPGRLSVEHWLSEREKRRTAQPTA